MQQDFLTGLVQLLVQHLLLVPDLSSEIFTFRRVHSLVAACHLQIYFVKVVMYLLRTSVAILALIRPACEAFDWSLLLAVFDGGGSVVLESLMVVFLEGDVVSVVGPCSWMAWFDFSFLWIFTLSHWLGSMAVLEA